MKILMFFFCCLSLLASSLSGQELSPETKDKQRRWSIGFDVNGLTIMPLVSAIALENGQFLRTEVHAQFDITTTYYVDLAFGRDIRKGGPVYANVYDLDYLAEYIRLSFGAQADLNEKISALVHIGMMFGQVSEKGDVRIGGGFFDPFSEGYSHDYTNQQIVMLTGLQYALSDRFHLAGLAMGHTGKFSGHSGRSIAFVPGGAGNTIPRGPGLFSISPRVYFGVSF